MKTTAVRTITLAALSASAVALPAMAAESDEELAKKTLNPVASLISLPMKLDYDHNIGPIDHPCRRAGEARQGEGLGEQVSAFRPPGTSCPRRMSNQVVGRGSS